VANPNTVAGWEIGLGANLNQGDFSIGNISRSTIRLMTNGGTNNVRYWIGNMMDGRSGDFGSGSNLNATDTPNFPYCAFRYSSGTDSTWKAVCGTSSSNQTVVDTGVVPSTTQSYLFNIDFTTTSATFSINGNTVATITSNLPATNNFLGQQITVDNKNTATAVSMVFFWSQVQFLL
jgi:hypothetical protein